MVSKLNSSLRYHWDHPSEVKESFIVCLFHHFGGNSRSLGRARNFFLNQGIVCLTIENSFSNPWISLDVLKVFLKTGGLRYHWAQEILSVLNGVDQKILFYSLSFPSHSVHIAMSQLKDQNQIKGWITEGGPFFSKFWCVWNLFTYAYPVKNFVLRLLQVVLAQVIISGFRSYRKSIIKAFKRRPQISILVFIDGADLLVPGHFIKKYFELSPLPLKIQYVELEGVSHLKGFSNSLREMDSTLKSFISEIKENPIV